MTVSGARLAARRDRPDAAPQRGPAARCGRSRRAKRSPARWRAVAVAGAAARGSDGRRLRSGLRGGGRRRRGRRSGGGTRPPWVAAAIVSAATSNGASSLNVAQARGGDARLVARAPRAQERQRDRAAVDRHRRVRRDVDPRVGVRARDEDADAVPGRRSVHSVGYSGSVDGLEPVDEVRAAADHRRLAVGRDVVDVDGEVRVRRRSVVTLTLARGMPAMCAVVRQRRRTRSRRRRRSCTDRRRSAPSRRRRRRGRASRGCGRRRCTRRASAAR